MNGAVSRSWIKNYRVACRHFLGMSKLSNVARHFGHSRRKYFSARESKILSVTPSARNNEIWSEACRHGPLYTIEVNDGDICENGVKTRNVGTLDGEKGKDSHSNPGSNFESYITVTPWIKTGRGYWSMSIFNGCLKTTIRTLCSHSEGEIQNKKDNSRRSTKDRNEVLKARQKYNIKRHLSLEFCLWGLTMTKLQNSIYFFWTRAHRKSTNKSQRYSKTFFIPFWLHLHSLDCGKPF